MGYGGKGKGKWGNAWQWTREKKSPPPLPDGFTLDEEVRYTGKVETFYKWQGYGFITVDTEGVVPDKKLFVHWNSIQTEDRYPFLMKDQEVEFNLVKWIDGYGDKKVESVRAKHVTLPGGAPVTVQDALDAEKKTFVGSQSTRYNGKLKFYHSERGFGYITVTEGQGLPEDIPKELRVEEAEVNCGGKRPQGRMVDIDVQFGIVKNKRDQCLGYNMTLPDGSPLLREKLENRKLDTTSPGTDYTGTVSFFHWRQGWGFIKPSPEVEATFSPEVREKLEQMVQAAKDKGKTPQGNELYFAKGDIQAGFKAEKDSKVTFQLYTDDKGAGACQVRATTD